MISDLLKIRWWDWPEEKIQMNIQAIQSGQIGMLEGTKEASKPRK